jgi:hypothetical protein
VRHYAASCDVLTKRIKPLQRLGLYHGFQNSTVKQSNPKREVVLSFCTEIRGINDLQ